MKKPLPTHQKKFKILQILITLIALTFQKPVPNHLKTPKNTPNHHHEQYRICKIKTTIKNPQTSHSEKIDICLQCAPSYYLKQGQCHKCPLYCHKCTSKKNCYACEIGSFLKNRKCLPCKKKCAICTSYDTCEDCNHFYNLVEGKCVDHFEGENFGIFSLLGSFFLVVGICVLGGKFLMNGVNSDDFRGDFGDGFGEVEMGDVEAVWDAGEEEGAKLRSGDSTRGTEADLLG